jgi:hypothetical protein
MSPKLPVVFIFDLDSTLICDSSPLTSYMQFMQFLRDAVASKKIALPNVTASSLRPRPMSEVIPDAFFRRDMASSLSSIADLFPTAEFFVFSAGEKSYVESKVKLMEDRFGLAFQRPVFSRRDCTVDETGRYKKSILAKMPRILDSLQDKYPALKSEEHRETVVKYNLVFVDDNDVVWDLKDKWIPCPAYSYIHTIDATVGLPRELLKHEIVREYINTNSSGFAEPPPDVSDDERNLLYHSYLANAYRIAFTENKKASDDDFFSKMTQALKTVSRLKRPFSEKNMKRIRDAIKSD